MWPILNYRNPSGLVQTLRKTGQDNNVTDKIGAVYIENETELSWPIRSSAICDENQQENDATNHNNAVYIENDTKLLWPIGSSVNYAENKIGQLRDWLYKCGLRQIWN